MFARLKRFDISKPLLEDVFALEKQIPMMPAPVIRAVFPDSR